MIVTPEEEWVGKDIDELHTQNGVYVEHGAL
jgi:hypothetical protein